MESLVIARTLGNIADDEWLGMNDKTYNVTADKGGGLFSFRSNGLKSRGFFNDINKSPTPLPHNPSTSAPKVSQGWGDVQGCGNPICVVLDRKVFRFPSLCAYARSSTANTSTTNTSTIPRYICDENRKEQMNFIQKGDCYDISETLVMFTPQSMVRAWVGRCTSHGPRRMR